MTVDEGNQLACQVIGIAANRCRVHVLIAAKRCEAIGEHDDRRSHSLLRNEARNSLGNVLVERAPVQMREPRSREPDEIEQHREVSPASAAAPARDARVVAGRKPYGEPADMRGAKRIVS